MSARFTRTSIIRLCRRCPATCCISTRNIGRARRAYRIPAPTPKLNLDGKLNYVYAETRGRGHLMGVTLGVLQNADGWWGEGDEMIFVDDESKPVITGTGSEDYFLGSWDFGGRDGAIPFAHRMYGAPLIVNRRAHRRPLLLLSLARRQSGDVHALFEAHDGTRPRQRSRRQFLLGRLLVSGGRYTDFPAMPAVQDRIPRVKTA